MYSRDNNNTMFQESVIKKDPAATIVPFSQNLVHNTEYQVRSLIILFYFFITLLVNTFTLFNFFFFL